MTTKDYIKLADAIKGSTYHSTPNKPEACKLLDKALLMDALCEILKADNDRFKEELFRIACKVEEER